MLIDMLILLLFLFITTIMLIGILALFGITSSDTIISTCIIYITLTAAIYGLFRERISKLFSSVAESAGFKSKDLPGSTGSRDKTSFKSTQKPHDAKKRYTPWRIHIKDIMNPILGIDLGTTKSLVGTIYNNDIFLIKNKNDEVCEPSLVTIDRQGIICVGCDAKKSLERLDSLHYSIGSIKRQMGRVGGTILINGRKFYPQIVSAMILAHLKKQAERQFGMSFERAIISVPANFNSVQRYMTKEAAELAGLKVLRITNEAVAAAVCYGSHQAYLTEERIMVVDFGGGTLDVTVVEIWSEGGFKVLTTYGDPRLGGDDFTEKMYEYICNWIKGNSAIYPANTYINRQRLWEIAEKVKIQLSFTENVAETIPYLEMENRSHKTIDFTINRSDFENNVKNLVDRMAACINEALRHVASDREIIDKVILVGGTSKTPCVKKKIKELLGDKIVGSKHANPDTAVAEGTILMGGIIGGAVDNILLLDVLESSIGIELEGGKFDPLIKKNSIIPTKISKVFTTTKDNQNCVDVSLYEGENDKIANNDFLLNFRLDGIPPAKKGVPKIEVTLEVDVNGVMHVTAKDLGTGKDKSEKIDIYSTLTQSEKSKIGNNIRDWAEFNKMFDL